MMNDDVGYRNERLLPCGCEQQAGCDCDEREDVMTVRCGTFTFDCPEECGATFALPVAVISTEPASRGQIVFTIRMDANNDAGERYKSHMMGHYLELGLIDNDED